MSLDNSNRQSMVELYMEKADQCWTDVEKGDSCITYIVITPLVKYK